ncbi:MAG: hypothetical protein ACRD0O_10240 [Acidimicrobiia bacterium]
MRPLPLPLSRRRLAVALALVALPFAASPASAHDKSNVHEIHWVDTGNDDSPDDGDRLYGLDFVAARAYPFDDGVNRWRVEMRPKAGGEPAFCDKTGSWGSDLSFRCNWDTTRLGDMTGLFPDQSLAGGPVAANGEYIITVTVWNKGRTGCSILCTNLPAEAHVLSPSRTVILQNPVSSPTGVSRSYDSNTGKVTVTWAPSPEPDIQKYIIQEKKGSGGWDTVGERPHGSTSFDRQIADVGTYQYRVAAVRPEVAQSGFSEAPALEVAAPPAPPSATGDTPAEPLGPEPGVTVLEPPTTSTTVQAGAVAPRPPSGGSSLFARPSAGSLPRPSAPKTTPTTVDTGYSAELPYDTAPKTQNGVLEDPEELAGAEQPQSMTRLITVPRPRDPRSLLVPLAGGLTIFVFAMQMTYVVRRRPALVQIDDDFGDWTGL